MGLFSKLFGGSRDDAANDDSSDDAVVYEGYVIRPAPQKDGSSWRIAGSIVREGEEDAGVHRFVRADTFPGRDDAVEWTVRKARQIIDERGDRVLEVPDRPGD